MDFKKIRHYLSIILFVVFIVCTINIIYKEICKRKEGKNGELNEKQKKFLLTLTDMADILESNNIHYFLLGGTALGCHREKKFIEHDKDIDLGIFEDVSFTNILNIVNKSGKFKLKIAWPRNTDIENATELTFTHKDTLVNLDIFKHIKKGEYKYISYAYGGKCDNKPRNRCEYLDIIKLNKVNFLGRMYNVPEISYIENLYGDDWKIPKYMSYDEELSIIN